MLNPFEGLFVGEPLAAPFARPGSADWSSLTNGTVLSGQTTLSLTFTAAATNLPLARADLFVDGTFFQTMTNLPPAAGNILSVTLNGYTFNYTVPTNATLATVAAGLANALNPQSNITQVLAFPVGDRIELAIPDRDESRQQCHRDRQLGDRFRLQSDHAVDRRPPGFSGHRRHGLSGGDDFQHAHHR